MKGIVMKKKNDNIIAMTKDGQFLEIKSFNKSVEIGQEIDFRNNMSYNHTFIKRAISIAAAFLFMVTGAYGVYGYYVPFGYVDVDINPSVELSYNLYDRVIAIKGLNEDGTNIIAKIDDYKNKSVEDIITKIIDKAIEEEYIKQEEQNAILVTITEAGSKVNDKEIFQSVDNYMKEKSIETDVVLIKSDKQSYETAKDNNLSPGKHMLINKALDSSDNINEQDMKDKSVKDIMSIIKENKKEVKKEEIDMKFGIRYQNEIDKESEKNNDNNDKNSKKNKNEDAEDIKQNTNSNSNNNSNSRDKNIKDNNKDKNKDENKDENKEKDNNKNSNKNKDKNSDKNKDNSNGKSK